MSYSHGPRVNEMGFYYREGKVFCGDHHIEVPGAKAPRWHFDTENWRQIDWDKICTLE